MSEEEQAEGAEAKPAKNKLMLILILVNTIALVGLGGYFVVFGGGGGGSQAAPQTADPAPGAVRAKFGPLVEMRSIVANLNDENQRGFAKVTLRLEVIDDETKVIVEEGLIPIRNRLLIYLSNLTRADTIGAEKKEAVRLKLKELIKEVLGGELVKEVYFTEFVVQ